MITAAKLLNIPLVVTEQNAEKLGRIVSELDVTSAVININKMKFSMVTSEIHDWLKANENRRSVAHVCIMQTVMDLLDGGYDVTVLADGISAQQEHDIKLAFKQMRSWGTSIVSSESLLFRLMRGADHEKFRLISALVKERIPYPH